MTSRSPGLVTAVPVGLVLLQPDLGSALVLVAMAFGVVAVAGAPKRLLLAVGAIGVAGVVAMFTTRVLSAYQRARLTAFLDPSADPEGIGYQTRQVRIAIGQGGWFGQGLFQGPQTQSGAIPFQQTDFVFSVAGEEWGFLGAAGRGRPRRVPHPAHPAGGRRAVTRSGSWSASASRSGSRCRRSRTSG